MNQIFPYANVVAGLLVLVIGFGFHWIGQSIALANRDLAVKLGIGDKEVVPEYEHFERGIAVADVILGWIYGVAAIGLILDTGWGYKLAWFPGVVLVYHSLSFWFWTANQKKAGHRLVGTVNPTRTVWFLANFLAGLLTIAVAWAAQ